MELVVDFLKKNWLLIAIAIAALIYVQVRLSSAEKVLNATVESNKVQVETLKELHAQELEGRNKAIKEHEAKIKDLQDNYKKKVAELNLEKKKRIQETVKLFEDKEKLILLIKERYGFVYVPVEKNSNNIKY